MEPSSSRSLSESQLLCLGEEGMQGKGQMGFPVRNLSITQMVRTSFWIRNRLGEGATVGNA